MLANMHQSADGMYLEIETVFARKCLQQLTLALVANEKHSIIVFRKCLPIYWKVFGSAKYCRKALDLA